MRALITGVNSLVNMAMLAKLLEMGYEVTAHYHSDNRLSQDLKARYPNVRFLQADFSSKDDLVKFVAQVMDEPYDVLVNAAVYYARRLYRRMGNEEGFKIL